MGMVLSPDQFALPNMPEPPTDRVARETGTRPAAADPRGRWSGPIPGQFVMPPSPLSHSTSHSYQHQRMVDEHGLVKETGVSYEDNATNQAPAHHHFKTVGGKYARPLHEEASEVAGMSGMDTHEYLNRVPEGVKQQYEEGHDRSRKLWDPLPVTQVSAHSPIHTSQSYAGETMSPDLEGPEKVQRIQDSLEAGEPMREPLRLVRQSGRLFSLDGHHRVVAGRQAGLESFPAKIWDRDSES